MVRIKKRYILMDILPDDIKKIDNHLKLDSDDVRNAVLKAIEKFHGDYGAGVARSGLDAQYVSSQTHTAIIKVRRDVVRLVTTCLPFITEIGSQKVIVKSIHLSGTIKSCKKRLIKYHQLKIAASRGKKSKP